MAPTPWRQLWHRRHTNPFPPAPKGQLLGAPETSTAAMRELLATAATRQGRARHAHEDHRASHRMLLAAALLRQGEEIGTVAAETHVPMALLELVRDELGHQATPPQHPPHSQRRRSPRAWQRVAAVAVIEVAIANIVMSITALVWHSGSLGMLSGIVTIVLVLAVRLLSRLLSPTQKHGSSDLGGQRASRG